MLMMKGLFQTHNILLDICGIEADKHIENTNTEDEESNNFPFLHLSALVWLSSRSGRYGVWRRWFVKIRFYTEIARQVESWTLTCNTNYYKYV